jgi:signal transduction histidine kinase
VSAVVTALVLLAVLLAAAAAALTAELRRRRELAARAAHDLRGPLTAARLALELARRDAAPAPTPDAAALEAADRELVRAGDAVEDLERAARGRGPARQVQGVAVGALAAGQVEVWRPVALAAGRRLRLGLTVRDAVVPGDPRLLRRALANLVANALEHGEGDVTVSARRRGDHVRLEVQDGAAPAGRPRPGAAPAGGPRPVVVRPASPLADVLRGGGHRRGHGLGIAATVAAAHGGRLLLGRDAAGTVAILELPLPSVAARGARFGRAAGRRPRPATPPAGGASSPPSVPRVPAAQRAARRVAAEGGD